VKGELDITGFIGTATHNLLRLRENLRQLGYRFANPSGPIIFAEEVDRANLRRLEKDYGPLPELYRAWYEKFRLVDFSQEHSQVFSEYQSDVAGLGYTPTLVWLGIEECISLRESVQGQSVRVDRSMNGELRRLVPIGTVASNCEPKGVWLPDSSIDPVLYDDGGGPVTMSDEIRMTFAHAGFPFWGKWARKRIRSVGLKYTPNFSCIDSTLFAGLVPFDKK